MDADLELVRLERDTLHNLLAPVLLAAGWAPAQEAPSAAVTRLLNERAKAVDLLNDWCANVKSGSDRLPSLMHESMKLVGAVRADRVGV